MSFGQMEKKRVSSLKAGDIFYNDDPSFRESGPYVLWVKTNSRRTEKVGKKSKEQFKCVCLSGTVDEVWFDFKDDVILYKELKEWNTLAKEIRESKAKEKRE